MSEFITYEKFATIPELKAFVELLKANEILYELEDDVQLFDASFANISHHRDYRIKLYPEDFDRVNELRNTLAEVELDEIDPDYYLFQFTNEELIDLIAKQDEWSPFDYQLAQKILKQRGNEVSSEKIDELKEQRIEELSEPEKNNSFWIVAGYILAIFGGLTGFVVGFIFPLIFGLSGLIIGWYIVSSKKVLPNGERVHTYSESDRKHGKIILIIGIPVFIIGVTFRLLIEFLKVT